MAVLTDNLTEIILRAGRTPAAVAIPAFVLALNPVHPAPCDTGGSTTRAATGENTVETSFRSMNGVQEASC